jgi:large subunit ribosomal protein L24
MKNSKKQEKVKLNIKKGDTVVVLSGDSKGETGVVQKILLDDYRAIVEGVNKVKRHVKPSADTPGGIIEKEASIQLSNLMLMDANGVASRIKREKRDGKTVRVSKKTQEVI